jgi:hypothetical protein
MAARITLATVNNELARRGSQTLLTKGPGYYYFRTGEADDWLDRTVPVTRLSALTLEQWIGEFERLKKVNQENMGTGKAVPVGPGQGPTRRRTPKDR